MPEPDARQESQFSALIDHLRRPAILSLALAAVAFVLYSGTLSFGFVYDDHHQIVNNPLLRSWSSAGRAFVSDLWFQFNRGQLYYRPLFVLWSIFNYALFGLNAWGWHLGAVLLHAGASVAAFALARKLRLEYWTAALTGLLFAIHPIHIESSAWVSAASDSMTTLLCMLAFIAFLNTRIETRRRLSWGAASLALLALALLTKEAAISFVLVAGTYAYLFPAQGGELTRTTRVRQAVLAALPFLVITAAYLLTRKIVLHRLAGAFDPNHSLLDVVRTLPQVLGLYLRLLIAPYGITGLYDTPYVNIAGLRNFYLPLLAILAFSAGLWLWTRRSGDKRVAFFGAWMLLCLLPALNLRSFVPGSFVRDRYVYLSSFGFMALVALVMRSIPLRKLQAGVTMVLCVGLATGTIAQQIYWGSDLLLFKRGYDLYPNSSYNMASLGAVLGAHGQYQRSLELLEQANRRNPEDPQILVSLAEAYARMGRVEDGRHVLSAAVRQGFMTGGSESETSELIGLLGRMGEYDQALSLCSGLLAKEAPLYSALYNCGTVSFLSGHYPQAEELLMRAIQQSPALADPRYFLGRVLLQTGRNPQAQERFREAIRMRDDVAEYHTWLGIALQQAGKNGEARQEFLAAARLDPDNRSVQERLHSSPADK